MHWRDFRTAVFSGHRLSAIKIGHFSGRELSGSESCRVKRRFYP